MIRYIAILILPTLLALGCAESYFPIPCGQGQPDSKMWSSDSRTAGWKGVDVTYALFGDGIIEADVRSRDGRHHFRQQGEFWYEDGRGGTVINSYEDQRVMAVRFGGSVERYEFSWNAKIGRVCIILAR